MTLSDDRSRSQPDTQTQSAGSAPIATEDLTSGQRLARPPSRPLDRNLTEGSIPRNLFTLAWPQIVAGVLQTLDQLADLVWAGFLGTRAIAGIGVAQSWGMLAATARFGFDTSTRAMVSRAVGAGDLPLANHVALQSFVLNGIVTAVTCIPGIIFTEFLLRLVGASDGIIAEGASYMRWQFMAQMTFALIGMSTAVLQATGDAITPMKAQLTTRAIHLFLSPLLVFGLGFVPALGLAGASIASALAQLVGAGMCFYVLFTGRSRLHLTLKGFRLDFPLLWRMFQIGAPAAVTGMERSLAQVILVGLVSPFGDAAQAAYAITNRVQMLVNLGSMGLGQSCGVLVGQNLGAGRPERSRATVWWALGFSLATNGAIGAIILLFPQATLLLFTRDAALLEVALPWLQIQVLGFIIFGPTIVFQQAFQTAGDTIAPMVVTLVTIWGVQQPLAIMLSGVGQSWELFGRTIPLPSLWDLGQFGIAWAIVTAVAARLIFYFPYFLWGPWLKKKVL